LNGKIEKKNIKLTSEKNIGNEDQIKKNKFGFKDEIEKKTIDKKSKNQN
jgi:hypothetical protein